MLRLRVETLRFKLRVSGLGLAFGLRSGPGLGFRV